MSSQLVMKDIHSVSSLLKMYFRELPNPVCTFSLYDRFVSAVQSTDEDEKRSCELRKVLSCLPKPNHRTLASLVRHLHRVSLHSDSTGMTAKNLAIVWAPNLLRYLPVTDLIKGSPQQKKFFWKISPKSVYPPQGFCEIWESER